MTSLDPAVRDLVAAQDVNGLARLAGYRRRFGSWKPSGRDVGAALRVPAVQGLGELGSRHPDSVGTLLTTVATADPDQDVRAAAVSGLGVLGSRVRASAVEAVGRTTGVAGREVWACLLHGLADPSRRVRSAAALALGERPESRTEEGLAALAGLGTAEAVIALGGVRGHRRAVRGAGADPAQRIDEDVLRPAALRAPDAYFSAIDLLAGRDDGRRVRSALVEALGDSRCAPLGQALARRLEDRSDTVLRELVDALAETGAKEAGPALLDLLGDRTADRGARWEALVGLESLGVVVPVGLLDGMGREAASYVERQLAGREDAEPALVELATRSTAEPSARRAALDLLATRSLAGVVEPLLELALDEHESAEVRVRAVEVLGGAVDDRVAPALERILVADTGPAEPELGAAPEPVKGHEAALNDPWGENPQYLIRWRPRSGADVGVAAGLALAPVVDAGADDRVRLGVWLAQRQAEEIRKWVEEQVAPGSGEDRSDAVEFLLRRLDRLDVEPGMDVALALQGSGSTSARELVGSLRTLAQQMTSMVDVQAEEVFMGDQTIQKHTVTVSREETRARGRAYLARLGGQP